VEKIHREESQRRERGRVRQTHRQTGKEGRNWPQVFGRESSEKCKHSESQLQHVSGLEQRGEERQRADKARGGVTDGRVERRISKWRNNCFCLPALMTVKSIPRAGLCIPEGGVGGAGMH